MTVQEAKAKLTAKYPDRLPVGYWTISDGFVFNTKPIGVAKFLTAPGQYVVTNNGEVYGTNPMRHDCDPAKMKKL